MNKLLFACLCASLPAGALAHEAIEGTWKIDVDKVQMPAKPYVYLLKDGIWSCSSCVPPVRIKADGSDQKVTGNPYHDAMAVKIVDARTIHETEKRNGKVVGTLTMTVADDDRTASFEYSDSSNSNAAPVTGKGIDTRVAKGPPGAHAVSGSWRITSFQNVSDNGLSFTYAMQGQALGMTMPTGQSYVARLDGSDAPYKGDPGTTSVSLRRLGDNAVEETDKRKGKPIGVSTMTVSADGRTMTIVYKDLLQGTTSTFVATKQ